ncbi:MAG: BTAD domain-containing putative transcriptional regulator [Nitriliruptorales bacterium]
MEFRILGPFEVVADRGAVVLPRGRGRALLALLVLRAGEVVAVDRLIEELWGESPPPTAAKALHGLVSTLRKRLQPVRDSRAQPAMLETCPPGYVLAIDRSQIDADRFRRLVTAAAGEPARERARQLRAALGLWRGPALAEFTYQPFAQNAIAELEELRLVALEERIDADLVLGRHVEVVAELEALVSHHPFRERLRGQLMLALYRSERQAEALEVYRDARRMLVEELGIEPGEALQGLQQAILSHDPVLDLLSSAAPAPTTPETSEDEAGLAEQPWLMQERKTVTVVFVGLTESMERIERSDPEALQRIMRPCFEAATGALERHGGTVEGVLGGVVVAVFGVPSAHENDALRAVRATDEVRRTLTAMNEDLAREHGIRLAPRIGVNTGEVVVGYPGAGPTASGDTVNRAARLQEAAADGEVLMGEATRQLVEDAVVVEPAGSLTSEGRGQQTVAWRLVDLIAGSPDRTPRRDAPLVGRLGELVRLRRAFDRVVREGQAALVSVVGEAGVGKSRLALEFADALAGEARILIGRCPSYGEGITFWPLREIVLQAVGGGGLDEIVHVFGGDEDARSAIAQVASAIGLAEEAVRAVDLFPAVRRFFEALARRQPLVVILDDLHWAQPTLLDLVAYLASAVRGALLLLCLARSEASEQHAIGAEDRVAASLLLSPLSPVDSRQLVAERLAGQVLPPETVAHVVETAQGNPLFLEQLVAALRDDKALPIPPSLQALLAARLDRLGPAERDLLRYASVVGIDFSLQGLAALVPDEARPFAVRHLRTLEDRELIRPSRRPFLGQEAFGFRHVLIQLAAYASMTRQSRAELHERFARWLETEAGAKPWECEEVVGYHLEQAYLHRRDLGLVDPHTRTLTLRAGELLAHAGDRAFGRFDVAAAENLWARAIALLPANHRQRPQVNRRLVEAYQVLGRHEDAGGVLAEMLSEVGADDSPVLEQRIRLERARIRLFTGPDPISLRSIRDLAEQARKVFQEAGDEAGLALASYVLGVVHLWTGDIRQMEKTAWQGLAQADRSGEPREKAAARVSVVLALASGETPVPECLRACEQLTPWLGMEHPLVMTEAARLRAMLGEFDEARELISRARRLLIERIRARRPQMFATGWSGEVEIMAGDSSAGERELRTALDMAVEMREREWVSQFAAHLSRLLTATGAAEGESLARLSVEAAPAENIAAQALSRAALARVLVHRESLGEAERLGRAAVQLVPAQMLNLRADLHVDLAEILLAGGQLARALPVIDEAEALYERKGNLVGAARARTTRARASTG